MAKVEPDNLRKVEKLNWLAKNASIEHVNWQALQPDSYSTWLVPKHGDTFSLFLPIGDKETKALKDPHAKILFKMYGGGLKTNRDDIVYGFDQRQLADRMRQFIEDYNSEVDRFKRSDLKGSKNELDNFVNYDNVKWSEGLKGLLKRGAYAKFDASKMRTSLYRPFTKQNVYFDDMLNERRYQLPRIFPTLFSEIENRLICVVTEAQIPFSVQIANYIPALHYGGRQTQCFPFYVYDPDGTNRRENITDWALAQFRTHYADDTISKWDIFYYVYGALHHPGYREKFADNLKRELPRIPYAPDFRAFADNGRTLADLHLNYETVAPYKLRWIEAKDIPLSYHVEKMRLSKDKTQIVVNESLTLADIPPEAFAYRLGNRSALEWVIDQYQVTTDKRSGITSDPNREDEPRYIVDLVGRVIQVSVETVRIVAGLPAEYSAVVAQPNSE